MIKKVTTVSLIAITSGFGAYLMIRKNKIKRIVNKLKFSVKDVQNFNISGGKLKADLLLRATNPTTEDLNLNTGFIKADKLRVYEKVTKKILAVSDLQINEIILPAKGVYDFPALNVQIPLITGAIIALSQLISNKNSFKERLTIELDLKSFNHTKTIIIK